MSGTDLKSRSKYLSYLLRHDPGTIGLEMDAQSWVPVDQIAARADPAMTRAQIEEVVRTSAKQRFALSADGQRIRANQGHSFPVDLGLAACTPPELLFHGTAQSNLALIRAQGLERRERQHVHLSPDAETARQVGMRHGTPVVMEVEAGRMHAAGHTFWFSENGVWLCDHVPPEFLRE